jgi:predicted NUDIX family NTP pyrophosphohydrolase
MARKQSAGVILYRFGNAGLEVFLVHPGGPFWARRDDGAWSIPKGEFGDPEPAEDAARREFAEETGMVLTASLTPLPPIQQSRAKTIHPFVAHTDFDPAQLRSNVFEMEWPPRSGRMATYPEVDRAAWFSLEEAEHKIIAGQKPLLESLRERFGEGDAARDRGHRSV